MYKPKVLFDDDEMGKDYGDVLTQPNPTYMRGEKAEVNFVGAHPRNNLRTMDTFLEVQRKSNGTWIIIYKDLDHETEYHWDRKGIAQSEVKIVWRIPCDEIIGEYRIIHHGDAKSGWTGKIEPYSGISKSFTVS
jgi:neutral ceramidase